MAQCSQSASEFIQGAFCPMVAVMCSEDAERVCQKNNLSFVELVRPFCQLTSEAHIRDPFGVTHPVKNWKLRLLEMAAPNPPQQVINKLLSEVVSRTQPLSSDSSAFTPEGQMRASTPWFEAYRDCFFQLVKPSDHEFIRHFLCCLIVVSSAHPDPLNAFATMSSQQLEMQQSQHNSHIKWFGKNVFKYHLLLHDIHEGVESKSEAIYQSMKSVYGTHACHLLQINTVNPTTNNPLPHLPDPWSQFIIPTSEETLDWDEDELDEDTQSVEDDPENCAVNEDFDPEVAMDETDSDKPRSGSGSFLIGPLSFEDEPELDQELAPIPKAKEHHPRKESDEKKHLANHYRYFSSRQFATAARMTPSATTKPRGMCLSLSDHDRIKIFIHELAIRGLLPFIEKTMRNLNDQALARKGIHRSIFSATRKWFGGGRPAGLASGLVPGIIYMSDAPELYQRKLGDLAFLVQNYELAYTNYHAAKRDFNGEHAWFYFAGALEMAAISAFMAGLQRPYPSRYMETSITTYFSACRQYQFATRATMLSTEALKSKEMYLEAAMDFMRMTSEESDLLSALLLEQSAHCFLHCKPPMIRKYAFHMILAGHRFSKSAQRKHALQCYKQALEVYRNKSWTLAEDHINFTTGRQSFNLRLLEDAQSSFRQLLVYESQQPPEQQASYLREFLFVYKQLMEKKKDGTVKEKGAASANEKLPILPLPMLDSNATRVILSYRHHLMQGVAAESTPSSSTGSSGREHGDTRDPGMVIGLFSFDQTYNPKVATRWRKLEEDAYECSNVTPLPPFFQSHVPCLSAETNNTAKPLCYMRESVGVEVVFYNSLKIPLNLSNLSLLWKFTPDSEGMSEAVSNELATYEDLVQTEVIRNFAVAGNERKPARLTLTPCCTGELCITGIKYSLSSLAISGPVEDLCNLAAESHPAVSAVSMLGRLDLNVRGPRLNNTKIEKTSVVYGKDNRLTLDVGPTMPLLEVRFYGFPSNLLCDEVVRTTVELKNVGQCTLEKLYIASSFPELFTFGVCHSLPGEQGIYQQVTGKQTNQGLSDTEVREVSEVPIPGGTLYPGASVNMPVWVQGSGSLGKHQRDIMFYYEPEDKRPKTGYRVLQHAFDMQAVSSVNVKATARRSNHFSETDSSNDQDQLIVAVDIESLIQGDQIHKHADLCVTQVSCCSQLWTVQPLSHDKNDGPVRVHPGEIVVVQLKAKRRNTTSVSSTGQDSTLRFSHVCLSEKQIDAASTPAVDFLFRSSAWREVREASSLTEGGEGGAVSNSDTCRLDMALIVFWESSFLDETFTTRTVSGQSHVALTSLAESLPAPTPVVLPDPVVDAVPTPPMPLTSNTVDSRELLVKYFLRHSTLHANDFRKARLCSIPVELVLCSCYKSEVDVFVELVPSTSEPSTAAAASSTKPDEQVTEASYHADAGQQDPPTSPPFVWVGQTSRRLQLKPNETSALHFTALLSCPGIYNLNNLKVLALASGCDTAGSSESSWKASKMVLQQPSPPSMIVIEDSSNSGFSSSCRDLINLDVT